MWHPLFWHIYDVYKLNWSIYIVRRAQSNASSEFHFISFVSPAMMMDTWTPTACLLFESEFDWWMSSFLFHSQHHKSHSRLDTVRMPHAQDVTEWCVISINYCYSLDKDILQLHSDCCSNRLRGECLTVPFILLIGQVAHAYRHSDASGCVGMENGVRALSLLRCEQTLTFLLSEL